MGGIVQGCLKIWKEHSTLILLNHKRCKISQQKFKHFYNEERYEFSQNLDDVAQNFGLPHPSEVLDILTEI